MAREVDLRQVCLLPRCVEGCQSCYLLHLVLVLLLTLLDALSRWKDSFWKGCPDRIKGMLMDVHLGMGGVVNGRRSSHCIVAIVGRSMELEGGRRHLIEQHLFQ